MSVNLKMDLSMGKGNGRNRRMQILIITKVITSLIKRTDTEFSGGHRETIIKASIKMMREMATAKCTGLTVPCTLESGRKEFSMDKER